MPPVEKADIKRFHQEIKRIVVEFEVDHLEAILIFCEENDFEEERAAKLISNSLKSDIRKDAEDRRLLKTKGKKRLPL